MQIGTISHDQAMARKSSISFKKRKDVDEIFLFDDHVDQATLNMRNSTIMVEYQDDDTALIIAGDIPGMQGFYKNYTDVVEGDEQKELEHELAQERLDKALGILEDYDPETSTGESNSGNRHLEDIYVEVPIEQRDEVIFTMWQVLNDLRDDYIEYLEEHEPEELIDHESLEEEIPEISKRIDLKEKIPA